MEQIQGEQNRASVLLYVFGVVSVLVFVSFLIISFQQLALCIYYLTKFSYRSELFDLPFLVLSFAGAICSLVFTIKSFVLLSKYRNGAEANDLFKTRKKIMYAWLIFVSSVLLFLFGTAGFGPRNAALPDSSDPLQNLNPASEYQTF